MGVVSVIAFTIIPPQLSAQIVPDVDRVEITISVAGCSTTPTFSVENDGASTVVTTDKAMGEIETNHPVFPWHYVHPGYDVDCPPVPPTKAFTITRVTLWKAGAAVYTSETANAEYRIVV
jgi:hypothetical protein